MQSALVRLLRTLRTLRPAGTREFLNLAALHIRRELLDLARHFRNLPDRPAGAGGGDTGDALADVPDRGEAGGDDLDRWAAFHEQVEVLPAAEHEVLAFAQFSAALENEKKANAVAVQRLSEREAAYEQLKEKQDELEGETARGWLLPLATERGPLSDQEIEAFSAVAAKRDERLAVRFVEEGIEEPRFTRRVEARSDYAIHAAVGLDHRKRQEVEQLLMSKLASPDLPEELKTDLAGAACDLGGLSAPAANVATTTLIRILRKAADPPAMRSLAERLSLVAGYLEPKEADRISAEAANLLLLAMSRTTNNLELQRLRVVLVMSCVTVAFTECRSDALKSKVSSVAAPDRG
jgi:hypothetical protein